MMIADMMYPEDLDKENKAICDGSHDHDEVHKHSHVAFARVLLSKFRVIVIVLFLCMQYNDGRTNDTSHNCSLIGG
jgi:hypothetical protein